MAEANIVALPPAAARDRWAFSHEDLVGRPSGDPETFVSDAVARWVLRVTAFALPLAFLPNLVSEFVLPKLLLLRLLLAALAILLVSRWFEQGAITWRRTPLDLPLLAFVASAGLSTLFAVNRNVAIFGTYDRWEGLTTVASYALLFFLSVQFLCRQSDARGLTWSLLFSGYVVGGAAILQSHFGLFGAYGSANGQIRADVTLAQPDFTGIFLGMLLPVALSKVFSRRPAPARVLAASIAIVLALGLVVTYTRAAWIGAAVGCIVVLAFRRGRFHLWPVLGGVAVGGAVLALAILVAGNQPARAHPGFVQAVAARVASIVDPNSPAIASRLRIWHDTPAIIASRPILGSGPDTFGLVSWQSQTSPRAGEYFDKPHMEVLGVAATQGLIGLAAYLWIVVTCIRCFWRGRRLPGAVALFGGFVAYQVSLQADFSWIPASLPYWLLLSAAIVTWAPALGRVSVVQLPRRIGAPALIASAAALLALLVPAVVQPYLADANYYASLNAATLADARALITQARQLSPNEAAYATEAGNYALNLDQNGNPAPDADWQAAQEAYTSAARLGSFSPEMFQMLALVDEHLGDHAGAVASAQHALQLDRYDRSSQKLLAALTQR